jgi:hypothetical protein
VTGEEIDVLNRGPPVGSPVVFRLVRTVPWVAGVRVQRVGRICAVPELDATVETDTLGVTVDVLTL